MHKANAFFHDCARGCGGGEVYYARICLRTAVRVVRVHLRLRFKMQAEQTRKCKMRLHLALDREFARFQLNKLSCIVK